MRNNFTILFPLEMLLVRYSLHPNIHGWDYTQHPSHPIPTPGISIFALQKNLHSYLFIVLSVYPVFQ